MHLQKKKKYAVRISKFDEVLFFGDMWNDSIEYFSTNVHIQSRALHRTNKLYVKEINKHIYIS